VNGIKPVDFSLFHKEVKVMFEKFIQAKMKRKAELTTEDNEVLGRARRLTVDKKKRVKMSKVQ
jgi:hypothetical protein